MADYWSDRVVFGHVAHLEVASATFEITADFSKSLPDAFTLTVTLRAAGVDIGSTSVPVQNGQAVQINLTIPGGGDVQGRIDNWRGIDTQGNVIGDATDPSWSTASSVAFTLTSLGDFSIPVSAILALVPHLGWAIAAALALFGGGKIQVNIGHTEIALPIHRDSSGKPLSTPV